jgi:hypothetical protein
MLQTFVPNVASIFHMRALGAEVRAAARQCRRATLPQGAVVAGDASIPWSGRPATTTRGQTREPRCGWARPWLTCSPIPAGQAVKPGRSSPAGEGALGGADGEQQQIFNDIASVSFVCCKSRSRCCNVVKLDIGVADVIFECCRCF